MTKDLVFGMHPVMEVIASGKDIDKILMQKNLQHEGASEILQAAKKLNVPVQRVPIEKLNRITRKNHQGVICYISPISFSSLDQVISDTFSSGADPFILVLDRVSDVRNFGAIVRTAECVGVHAILIPEKGSAALNSDAMKTSAGALNHIAICRVKNLSSGITFLKESGLSIVAMTEKTESTLYELNLTGPLGILLGSEEDGITPELFRLSDYLASLPLKGSIGSLNVSVSAGISLYEALRQRQYS